MRAIFEIEFKDKQEAGKALKILKSEKGKNSVLHVLHQNGGKMLKFIVEADSFSPLRARSTSLMRDLKVMLSVFKISQKNFSEKGHASRAAED